MKTYSLLVIGLISNLAVAATFTSSIQPIPKQIQAKMIPSVWHKGCPVPLNHLRYVQLSYWGFDRKSHRGELIVNKELASEVVEIFNVLYQNHFPIERMELMDQYGGDDNLAMANNNTSAFNCRAVTNRPGEFSQHSYGRAIDINTLINPFVSKNSVVPPKGAPYANRKNKVPGMIHKGDKVYQAFIDRGWDWGGNWYDVQDYQHFEKRANGAKRNPYGYPKKPATQTASM